MADRWFYARVPSPLGTGSLETPLAPFTKTGPCTGQELKDLAAAGSILPTDTIWKDGVEKGSLACKVRYLFPLEPIASPVVAPLTPVVLPASLESVVAPVLVSPAVVVDARTDPDAPPAPIAEASPVPAPVVPAKPAHVRRGNAVAIRGAVIVGQDGVHVKYKKKCTQCSHTESSWHTVPIRNGSIKAAFFCPKCKRNRDVEIKGSLS